MERLFVLTGAILLSAAPAAGEPVRPDAEQIKAAAAQCGLPAEFLELGQDRDGDFADIPPRDGLDRLDPRAFVCLIGWAEKAGARVGFISEPPPGPQTIAYGPLASVRAAAQAARRCGLRVHLDPLSPEEAVLMARRDAPRETIACTRSWIAQHWDALRFRLVEELD